MFSNQFKFTTLLLILLALLGVIHAGAYVAVEQTQLEPITLEVNNFTQQSLRVQGIRYSYDGGDIHFAYPYSWPQYSQSHQGNTHYSIFVPGPPNTAEVLGPGSNQVARPSWDPVERRADDLVPLIKAGSCNEPETPSNHSGITLQELNQLVNQPQFYDPSYRYLDTIGARGGPYSGGWIDTFGEETQIQWAIGQTPTDIWSSGLYLSDTNKTKGPMYWMALAAGQELFSMEAQFLMTIGMKETGSGSSTTSELVLENTDYVYGAFELDQSAAMDRMMDYPKFYPQFESTFQETFALDSYDAGVFFRNLGRSASDVYMEIFGARSDVTRAGMVNSVLLSGLEFHHVYQIIGASSDYCGKKAYLESADPYLGLCILAGNYNRGIYGAVPENLKDPDFVADPDACMKVPQGNHDYVPQMRSGLVAITQDQIRWAQGDPDVRVIDKTITFEQIESFFWGDGGTIDSPGANGLMIHYGLSPMQEELMWDDIQAAYQILSTRWGGNSISFRYDWISLLRIAKNYLDTEIPFPSGPLTVAYIDDHSQKEQCDPTYTKDERWPFVEAYVDMGSGFEVSAVVSDYETGSLYLKYKLESEASWTEATNTLQSGIETEYTFSIPFESVSDSGDKIWIRAADSCKNEVAIQVELAERELPYLDSAWAIDTDGDGYADQIHYSARDFVSSDGSTTIEWESLVSVNYAWPDASNTFVKLKNELTSPEYNISDTLLQAGHSRGSELKINWLEGSRSTTIIDRVGPAILYASMREESDSQMWDTLTVYLTEAILESSLSVTREDIEINGEVMVYTEAIQISSTSFQFVFPKGSLSQGDWVRLNPQSTLSDVIGNTPVDNNQAKEIQAPLSGLQYLNQSVELYDVNGDGTLDQLQVKLAQPIVSEQLSLLSFQFNWLGLSEDEGLVQINTQANQGWRIDPQDPFVLLWDIPSNFRLRPFYTYVDVAIPNLGYLTIDETQVDPNLQAQVQVLLPMDKMGPVIQEGSPFLEKKSDGTKKLSLTLSEPVQVGSSNRLFLLKINNREEDMVHQVSHFQLKEDQMSIEMFIDTSITSDFNQGDSMKIYTGDEDYILDLAKNPAAFNNVLTKIRSHSQMEFFHSSIFNFSNRSELEDLKYVVKDKHHTSKEFVSEFGHGFGFKFNLGSDFHHFEGAQYDVWIDVYTNLGSYVTSLKANMTCDWNSNQCADQYLGEDWVQEEEFQVYIPWDLKSHQGRHVGTGAYIVVATVHAHYIQDSVAHQPFIQEEYRRSIGVVR